MLLDNKKTNNMLKMKQFDKKALSMNYEMAKAKVFTLYDNQIIKHG